MKTITTATPIYQPDVTSFAGFYHNGTDVDSLTCLNDYTFGIVTSSNYNNGACCPNLSDDSETCSYPTRCTDGMAVYWDGSSSTCPGSYPCVEVPLYQWETATDDGWSVTLAWCFTRFDSGIPSAFYRNAMTTYTTTVNDDFSATTTASPSSSPEATPPIITPTESPTVDDPSETGIGKDGGSETNVGAIAGGTVGGVAGVVLIILAAWYVLRRRRAKSEEMRELGEGYVAPGLPK